MLHKMKTVLNRLNYLHGCCIQSILNTRKLTSLLNVYCHTIDKQFYCIKTERLFVFMFVFAQLLISVGLARMRMGMVYKH